VACLGNSRWRDVAQQHLGCVTCEVGNVLLKVFPADMAMASTCAFECLPGYERTLLPDGSEDCYLSRLEPSPWTEFSHSVAVGDYSWSQGVSSVRVTHTSHGFFAVVVVGGLPVGCRRGAVSAHCCFAALWRVSTLEQMGPLPTDSLACTGQAGLAASRTDQHTLVFAVPDSMLDRWQRAQRRVGPGCAPWRSRWSTSSRGGWSPRPSSCARAAR